MQGPPGHSVPIIAVTYCDGPLDGRQLRFRSSPITIGRSPHADVVIPREDVSRRHAEIRTGDQGAYLVDVGSTNGTYVDGRRIEALILDANRDYEVRFGDRRGSRVFIRQIRPEVAEREAPGRAARDPDAAILQLPPRWSRAPVGPAVPEPRPDPGQPLIEIRTDGFDDQPVRRFAGPVVVIGRSRSCDLVVPADLDGVSGIHAEVRWQDGVAVIIDRNSTNGTYVAGARIERSELTPGADHEIALGRWGARLTVRVATPAAQTAPVLAELAAVDEDRDFFEPDVATTAIQEIARSAGEARPRRGDDTAVNRPAAPPPDDELAAAWQRERALVGKRSRALPRYRAADSATRERWDEVVVPLLALLLILDGVAAVDTVARHLGASRLAMPELMADIARRTEDDHGAILVHDRDAGIVRLDVTRARAMLQL